MGGVPIGVVPAFTAIPGTEKAGLCAYYRSSGVTEITIADAIPKFRKILHYEDEYIIGEMLITDTGTYTTTVGNCAPVYAIVYNDGWIVTWINKDDVGAEFALSGCGYAGPTTLDGFAGTIEYPQQYNRMIMQIYVSSDSNCPVGTRFTITDCDVINGTVSVALHEDGYNFSSGYTYRVGIYSDLGNFMWNGSSPGTHNPAPDQLSNRLARAIYEIWSITYRSSNTTDHTIIECEEAYSYNAATGAWKTITSFFNELILTDNPIVGSKIYIGSEEKHGGIHINLYDNSVSVGEVEWEYYNGTTWEQLTVVDGSNGFKNHSAYNEITFIPPDDWQKSLVNSVNYLYYIRAVVTTEYNVSPRTYSLHQYQTTLNFAYSDSELGVYAFQYPDAEYLIMYGMFTTDIAYAYITMLPGTTVYRSIAQHSRLASPGQYEGNISINRIEVIKYPGYVSTPGYMNIDIDWVFYSVYIQNTFKLETRYPGNLKLSIISFVRRT